MKRITLLFCSAALLFAACNNETKTEKSSTEDSSKTAGTAKTEAPAAPMDSASMMKAWQEYMTPGEMHKLLASMDGIWEGEVSMWMAPGAPPSKSMATATNKMIYNGLYQESVNKGSFEGMPFEGKSIWGYDNARKKFVSSWIDNMGSGIMNMEGDYDAASKTFTFTGTSTNPMTGKKCDIREIIKIVDANTQVMEMYGPDIATGKEYKTMEIVSKRKK
jgi:hypothetical protein